jgi:hypothetical protein
MTIRTFAVALLGAAVVVLLTQTLAIAGTTGSLVGTVNVQYLGNAPVAGATVVIASSSQREQTTTDARGNFCFVSLAPGSYVLSVSRVGYETTTKEVIILADSSLHVSVGIPRRMANVRIDGYANTMAWVQQRTIADVYALRPGLPFYSFNGTDIYALHFVPGLTFGAGPVLSR